MKKNLNKINFDNLVNLQDFNGKYYATLFKGDILLSIRMPFIEALFNYYFTLSTQLYNEKKES